ncbi:MAG: hypothetical protein KC649_03770, partial [Candidatus Omnitrophica bacterium]|nr:hypothetical protein [Candidatus Omnitrophota bacterium]
QTIDKHGYQRLGWNPTSSLTNENDEIWIALTGNEWNLISSGEKSSGQDGGYFIPSIRTRNLVQNSASRLSVIPSAELVQRLNDNFGLTVTASDNGYLVDYSKVPEGAEWPMDRFRSQTVPATFSTADLVYPLEQSIPLSVQSASSVNNHAVTNNFLLNVARVQLPGQSEIKEIPVVIKIMPSKTDQQQEQIQKEVFISLKGYYYFPYFAGAIIQDSKITGYAMQMVLGKPVGMQGLADGQGVLDAVDELWNREGFIGAPEGLQTRVTTEKHAIMIDFGNLEFANPQVSDDFNAFKASAAQFISGKSDAGAGARLAASGTKEPFIKDTVIREFVLSVSQDGIGRTFGLATEPQLSRSGAIQYSHIRIEGGTGNSLTYDVDGGAFDIADYISERRSAQDERNRSQAQSAAAQQEQERTLALQARAASISETDNMMADIGVDRALNLPVEIPLNELAELARKDSKVFASQFEFVLSTLSQVHRSAWGENIRFHLSGLNLFSDRDQRTILKLIQSANRTSYITADPVPENALAGFLLTANAGLQRKESVINSVVDGLGTNSVPDWYRGIAYIAGVVWDVVPENRRDESFDTRSPESYGRVPSERLLETVNSRISVPFESASEYLEFVANRGIFDLKLRAVRPLLQKLNHLIQTVRTMIAMTGISA